MSPFTALRQTMTTSTCLRLFMPFLAPCLLLGPALLDAAETTLRKDPAPWALDMANPRLRAQRLPAVASWSTEGPSGSPALRLQVSPANAAQQHQVTIPVDLTPWRGCLVALSAKVRARDVSQPRSYYNGIKIMMNWVSPTGGEHHVNPNGLFGSFDWREARTVLAIEEDATTGNLRLGIQDSSGTAEIADVRLTLLRKSPSRPAPRWDANEARAARTIPMRGVMSPQVYRPDDFATLEQWKVNLVRWQLTRKWGKPDTDRDLAEYDTWLEGKFTELDLALADAAGKGIKLLIDLHSPPGGRYADKTMAMFCEKTYQDHFVAVWERIARRYKGHPSIWGYDLVNEPLQDRPSPPGLEDWYGLQVKAARAIRAIDPDTPIGIEVDDLDKPARFTWLTPVDVPNVFYQVHMYQPGEFTHQGVHNAFAYGEDNEAKPIPYPGSIRGTRIDRDLLRSILKPVRDFQLAYGARIYVGEFSAARWAPGADRYLADCIELFEDYGWDWTYHAFREFGGWSVEHQDLPYSMKEHLLAPLDQPTSRAQVLWSWFAKNASATLPPTP